MTQSPRYRWQTRWAVDLDAGTAEHVDGLRVRYITDRGQLRVEALNGLEILTELAPKHGGHNAPIMLQRLFKEALQMHEIALDRKER